MILYSANNKKIVSVRRRDLMRNVFGDKFSATSAMFDIDQAGPLFVRDFIIVVTLTT